MVSSKVRRFDFSSKFNWNVSIHDKMSVIINISLTKMSLVDQKVPQFIFQRMWGLIFNATFNQKFKTKNMGDKVNLDQVWCIWALSLKCYIKWCIELNSNKLNLILLNKHYLMPTFDTSFIFTYQRFNLFFSFFFFLLSSNTTK